MSVVLAPKLGVLSIVEVRRFSFFKTIRMGQCMNNQLTDVEGGVGVLRVTVNMLIYAIRVADCTLYNFHVTV